MYPCFQLSRPFLRHRSERVSSWVGSQLQRLGMNLFHKRATKDTVRSCSHLEVCGGLFASIIPSHAFECGLPTPSLLDLWLSLLTIPTPTTKAVETVVERRRNMIILSSIQIKLTATLRPQLIHNLCPQSNPHRETQLGMWI